MKTYRTDLFAKALSESADGSGLLLRAIARMSEAYTEVLGVCDEQEKVIQEALDLLREVETASNIVTNSVKHLIDLPVNPLIHKISQFVHKYSTTEVGIPPTEVEKTRS
jgi:hypothetical protein